MSTLIAPLEHNPTLEEQGWAHVATSATLVLMWRSNGFPDRLLVTFDALGETAHRRKRIGGDTTAVACEADHLHVAAASEQWFQCPELDVIINAAKAVRASYRQAILYGHSMGGYGALLFSGPLDATNVVAFVPQFSIDPVKVPFDFRFVSHAGRTRFVFDDMLASVSRTAPKTIVFDPYFAIDRQHYELIANVPEVHPLRIPFAGHYPAKMLLEGGVLREVVHDLLLQSGSPGRQRQLVRAARRRSHRYFVECAHAMARRGKLMLALRLVNIAYVLDPSNLSVLETYSAVLHSDSTFYGLGHAMLRLVQKEQPAWTQYDGPMAAMWTALEQLAAPVIARPDQLHAVDA